MISSITAVAIHGIKVISAEFSIDVERLARRVAASLAMIADTEAGREVSILMNGEMPGVV